MNDIDLNPGPIALVSNRLGDHSRVRHFPNECLVQRIGARAGRYRFVVREAKRISGPEYLTAIEVQCPRRSKGRNAADRHQPAALSGGQGWEVVDPIAWTAIAA